jgi:large subunit ribosomal protein L22
MKFLLTLIRNTWVPDALAQLKFTPKMLATDISKILRRAAAVAKINHDAIPEELWVKEVLVTKGIAQKRLRIMGRGRTGFGYRRRSNVVIKVAKINFDKEIALAHNFSQKKKWIKRKEFSQEMRKKREGTLVAKFVPPPTYMF